MYIPFSLSSPVILGGRSGALLPTTLNYVNHLVPFQWPFFGTLFQILNALSLHNAPAQYCILRMVPITSLLPCSILSQLHSPAWYHIPSEP